MNVESLMIDKVRKYFVMGLNYSEIGKLLDCSPRTVQRYMKKSGAKKEITEPKTTQTRAFELSAKGYSYSEIAKKLRVTKTTVYLWHKKRKAENPAEQRANAVYSETDKKLLEMKKAAAKVLKQ